MTVQVIDRPAFTVVGMQIRTMPMSPDIPALWPRFVDRMAEIKNPAEQRVTYGVMQGSEDHLDYMAAVAVTAAAALPPGMTRLDIPGGLYARFSYPLSRLGEGFGEIFDKLLPESAYVEAAGPSFERYGPDFCPDDANSPVEIWLPVKART